MCQSLLDLDPVLTGWFFSALCRRLVKAAPNEQLVLTLFLLVLLSRILCHTGVNVSSVAMATPALHLLISFSSV